MKIYIKIIGKVGERKHTLMSKLEQYLRDAGLEITGIDPSIGLTTDQPYTLKSWDAKWKVLP